jgi:imidazolonepropionase-like amidohydrolase
MRALICLISFLITAIPIIGSADSYLLNPKQILDVETGKLIRSKVLVTDGKIMAISNSFKASEDLKIINLPDLTLLPGLMDAHVHLIGNTELKGMERLSESSYLSTIYGVKNAQDTLMAGFTTVRNVGASNYSDVALKQAIAKLAVLGPTLLVSGPPLGITGGHCDNNTLPYDFKHGDDGVADGPWEIRKKVRENRKYGADLIKFCATGGVLSKNTNLGTTQYTADEMEAIVDEAHNRDMKVAAHAHGLDGIKAAILAGVDSIEHSSLIDEETIELAKAKGVFLSMDVYVSDFILGEGVKQGIPEYSLNKERQVGKKQRENFQKAVKANAQIAFGTDAGIYPHGKNARQFKYMVRWGMTPLQAIQAATINTASLFGVPNIGKIKESFEADIIGVKGNPLEDITRLEDVEFVMNNGIVIKQ